MGVRQPPTPGSDRLKPQLNLASLKQKKGKNDKTNTRVSRCLPRSGQSSRLNFRHRQNSKLYIKKPKNKDRFLYKPKKGPATIDIETLYIQAHLLEQNNKQQSQHVKIKKTNKQFSLNYRTLRTKLPREAEGVLARSRGPGVGWGEERAAAGAAVRCLRTTWQLYSLGGRILL